MEKTISMRAIVHEASEKLSTNPFQLYIHAQPRFRAFAVMLRLLHVGALFAECSHTASTCLLSGDKHCLDAGKKRWSYLVQARSST